MSSQISWYLPLFLLYRYNYFTAHCGACKSLPSTFTAGLFSCWYFSYFACVLNYENPGSGEEKTRADLAGQLTEDRVCLMYVTSKDSIDVYGTDWCIIQILHWVLSFKYAWYMQQFRSWLFFLSSASDDYNIIQSVLLDQLDEANLFSYAVD